MGDDDMPLDAPSAVEAQKEGVQQSKDELEVPEQAVAEHTPARAQASSPPHDDRRADSRGASPNAPQTNGIHPLLRRHLDKRTSPRSVKRPANTPSDAESTKSHSSAARDTEDSVGSESSSSSSKGKKSKKKKKKKKGSDKKTKKN